MNDKIMAGGDLENIMARLACCCALLDAVRLRMEGNDQITEETLFGISDLLNSICRGFQANIDSAEDYNGEGMGA